MSMRIEYVSRLDDICEPAAAFLASGQDIFEGQHIVVPTMGVKAWLISQLATRLGVSKPGALDGVVANVDISFPGTLNRLLHSRSGIDPWAVEHLTFSVLQVLAGTNAYDVHIARAGGPLLAARAIADRFDRYHMRRPAMIRNWEEGIPVLSPTANDDVRSGERVINSLSPSDVWQFHLWREVRKLINEPSPPARDLEATAQVPSSILVAGLQTLNLQQIQVLQHLAKKSDVHVLLVHPSAPLQKRWMSSTPETPGLVPVRTDIDLPDDVDPLVFAWLRGAHDAQLMLASQGLIPTFKPLSNTSNDSDLLHRMQQTVTTTLIAPHVEHEPNDVSVSIHRCHNIARQAEVLHDAILHAFNDLPDLQPHEVVVLCPDIAAGAPHLQATFARSINGVQLPLVVADRGIREVSAGAELLADLLHLIGSRCSVDDMMTVATSPLVLEHLRLNSETVEVWERYIERTNIRWGLDAQQRIRNGLHAGAIEAHSWKLGLERMILGAVLPDASAKSELGGVVPLADVDLADVDNIAALISIFNTVLELDGASTSNHSVGTWCDILETALIQLCGEDSDELAIPFQQIDTLRAAANETPVPFNDVKVLVTDILSSAAGRQPLRTGAITATSMVPLRGVPYRVVCVLGFDDTALGGSEAEGDDLVERQRLLGDSDSRLEIRRSFLDAMLSASDRFIVSCTATSIRNNTMLPLATPLAEFVDFAVRHGATKDSETHLSSIEMAHPRHSMSPTNFAHGAIIANSAWSHDPGALKSALAIGAPSKPVSSVGGVVADLDIVELGQIEQLVIDPLRLFVRDTLDINTWRDNEVAVPAQFPLTLTKQQHRQLSAEALEELLDENDITQWQEALHESGILPVGEFGTLAANELVLLATGMVREAAAQGISLPGGGSHDIRISAGARLVVGRLDNVHLETNRIVMRSTESDFDRVKKTAALHLLVAVAAGLNVESIVVVSRHNAWSPGSVTKKGEPAPVASIRTIRLSPAIDQEVAIARLSKLCDLVATALLTPCGSFDKAASEALTDRSKAKDSFNSFVHGRSYGWSLEQVVYGISPSFDDVFAPGAPELTFREQFDQQLSIAYLGSSKKGYEVA